MGPEWLLIGGLAAALGAAMAGVARLSTKASNPAQDRVQQDWQTVADELDGELKVEPQASLAPRRLELDVVLDGIPVRARTQVGHDPSLGVRGETVAAFALGAGPRYQLRSRRPDDPAGEAEALGDAELSARYQLRTEDPDAVAAAFDPATVAAMRAFPGGFIASDGKTVRLEWAFSPGHPAGLVASLRLASALASVGMQTLRGLAELEDARMVWTETGAALALTRHHVTVLLQGRATRGGPAYDARVEAQRAFDEATVRIEGGTLEGTLPPGLLGDVAEQLEKVGAATLELRGKRVKLTWDAPPDRARAESGARVVAHLARGGRSGGAFR